MPAGYHLPIEALPFVSTTPDERCGYGFVPHLGDEDGRVTLALVIDCYTRQLLGWQLSSSGRPATVRVLRTDNGSEFLGEVFTQWAKAHGMTIQYTQPGKPN